MFELRRVSARLSEVHDPETVLACIVAHMPIPVLLYLPDGVCLATNLAFRELMGVDLPPQHNILTDPAAIRAGLSEAMRRALTGEQVYRPPHWFDTTLLPGADRRLGLRTWFFPLYDAAGAVQYVAGCCIDATAELLLQEERDRQQMLRDCSGEVTVISLPDRTVTYVSPSSERVLGYTPEEVKQLKRQILHPEDYERWEQERGRMLSAPGTTIRSEYRIRHKDGSFRWFSITSINLAGHPTLQGIITHAHDITALKAAEEAQRQTAVMLEEALNLAGAVAWRHDFTTGKSMAVGQLAEILCVRGNITTEDIIARYHPDDRGRIKDLMSSIAAPGSPGVRGHRARVIHPETSEAIWVELNVDAVRDTGGRMIGTKGVKFDVTDRVRAEQAAAHAAELEAENRRIRVVNETKNRILAHLSHELRTPLNAIIGFGELLRDGVAGDINPDQEDFLGIIAKNAKHLLEIISDLLDLAQIEAGKLELHPERVHLPDLVREVCEALRLIASEKKIYLTTHVAPDVERAVLDERRVRQVLFNYISNAIKHTSEGGRVTVRIRGEGPETLRVEVQDTGAGISPEDIGQLFDEFATLGAARRDGTGLGLAITRSLVEGLGGKVGVTSVPGEGSTFHAVLPRDVAAALARREARTMAA